MDITAEQLRPVLQELGKAESVGIHRLTGGGSDSFRLDLADGERLVLKLYTGTESWVGGKESFRFSAA